MTEPSEAAARGVGDGIDWDALRDAARVAMSHAYAPYSRYPVGAAALVEAVGAAGEPGSRRIVTGCNVENASYGLGLCAECGLVSALHASGGGRLVAFACVDAVGTPLVPCGRCRQLLQEHGGDDLLLATPEGVLPLAHMLPQAFGPAHLNRAPGGPGTRAPEHHTEGTS